MWYSYPYKEINLTHYLPMKIKVNPITNLFHQLPQSHALRTTMMDAILPGASVTYDTAGTSSEQRSNVPDRSGSGSARVYSATSLAQ